MLTRSKVKTQSGNPTEPQASQVCVDPSVTVPQAGGVAPSVDSSTSNAGGTHSNRSKSTSSTVKARLQAEALHAKAMLEIEEQLAKAKRVAQDKLLAAQLAAIESSTRNNSVNSWVHSLPDHFSDIVSAAAQPQNPAASSAEDSPGPFDAVNTVPKGSEGLLPNHIRGPQGDVETFALLDDGSTASLIDSTIARQIGIQGRDGRIRIQGVGAELDNLVKEQFKLEALGITKRSTSCGPLHERALQTLDKTAERLPSGRFKVGLLWREDNPHIPDSYALARSRFNTLERKMAKDKDLKIAYSKFITDIIDKDYAKECDDTYQSLVKNNCRFWYLPHFAVFHPQKKKIRVVHDAAARTDGVSLNSLLLPGPDLLPSLLGILFRWREGRIAMIGDIKEMFPQVKIIERDQDMQRFLWRDADCEGPVKEYKMSSMIFGATSSPCTAIYILRKNAQEHESRFPDAADTIRNTYMDDCVISVNDVKRAARLVADIVELHSLAEFEMRGWVSNNSEALQLLPPELCATTPTSVVPLAPATSTCRVLGLIWDTAQDALQFRPTKTQQSELPKLTKRSVLSCAMSLYDPLGILSPLTVHSRILLQKCWRTGVSWDEPLPMDQQKEWGSWLDSIALVENMSIPRCYASHCNADLDQSELELHVFADASELAYASVAYWRILDSNGKVKLSFIAAKARVTPLRPVSMPRLELQGALLAARLAATILAEHNVTPCRRVFWIDSMNVLGWLRAEARSLKPFVANRVGEISEITEVCEWRWVPTSLNVADEATRMSSAVSSRWVNGPSFLLKSQETWPSETLPPVSLTQNDFGREFKAEYIHIHALDDQNSHTPTPISFTLAADPSRFSSWLRMVRATARAHQYIKILRNRINSKLGSHNLATRFSSSSRAHNSHPAHSLSSLPLLSDEDLYTAEVHIIRQCQEESFSEELRSIRRRQAVNRSSRLLRLTPTLDSEGLLRMNGRVSATPDMPSFTKRPIILDGRHHTARLLVTHYHKKAAHGLNELVVNEIRQRYWILRLRNTIRSIALRCTICTIRRASPVPPPMGDLPPERLAHHRRPFTFVGLDYMGPMIVAVGRRREKRYVALFTCLTTRAIHLEIVHSLSADAAVMCLRRFVARRGTPCKILSDNGTAFVGANNLLLASYQQCFGDECANQHISWQFIPPSAPNMGGAWERMVRTVKTALKAMLAEQVPKDELLCTALHEAEALVNSRPLTHASSEPHAPESLTPFHFLIGSSSPYHPIKTDAGDLLSRSDWKKSQRLAELFWQRWVKEYLPLIAPRRSPKGSSSQNFRVGDLVLIADGNLPRGTWPRGRISAVHPGKDGIIRVTEVTTPGGILRRPVTKLVKLPSSPPPD
ncbi:uncharacterized protein LOC135071404 [Ostrinia nubilalis]|uniref:uncharacterized protein LOC135071404 n=1 Tax=Ostrinia nubilalis TaxID=29057 RepID=UPI0030822A65